MIVGESPSQLDITDLGALDRCPEKPASAVRLVTLSLCYHRAPPKISPATSDGFARSAEITCGSAIRIWDEPG